MKDKQVNLAPRGGICLLCNDYKKRGCCLYAGSNFSSKSERSETHERHVLDNLLRLF